MDPTYDKWVFHGESSTATGDKALEIPEVYKMFRDANFENDFFDDNDNNVEPAYERREPHFANLVEDAELPLYGGSTYTKMAAVVALYKYKARHSLTDNGFNELLEILGKFLPPDNKLPDSLYSVKKLLKDFEDEMVYDNFLVTKQTSRQQTSRQQTMLHTTSRKGYARLEDEMRQQSDNPNSIQRVDVWIKGHKRKAGTLSSEAQIFLDDIEDTYKSATPLEKKSLQDDAVSKVIGPERRGIVRGLGFGATPSKVEGQKYNRDKFNRLESELSELRNVVKSLAEKVNGNNNTQNENSTTARKANSNYGVQSSTNRDITETRREKENVEISRSPNIGAKCKLLNWDTGSEVVAIGEIVSTNPKDLVYHVPIGQECYKLWVHEVIDYEVTLYRPTREFFLLHEALSSTIAWPIKYIIFD